MAPYNWVTRDTLLQIFSYNPPPSIKLGASSYLPHARAHTNGGTEEPFTCRGFYLIWRLSFIYMMVLGMIVTLRFKQSSDFLFWMALLHKREGFTEPTHSGNGWA